MAKPTFRDTIWSYIVANLEQSNQSFCQFLANKYPNAAALDVLAMEMQDFLDQNTAPDQNENSKQLLQACTWANGANLMQLMTWSQGWDAKCLT